MATKEEIDQILKKHLEPMSNRIEDMHHTLNEIKRESKAMNEKYNKLELNIVELQKDFESLKSEYIKKNLIFFGLPEQHNERLAEIVLKFCKEQLEQTDMSIWEISDVQRMGRKGKSPRGVKIELTTKQRKMRILEKTKLLKGTVYRIQPEYTKKVMEDRKILKPYMTEARVKGHRSYLVYNKLRIGEEIYTVDEITEVDNKETKECSKEKPNKSWCDSSEEDEVEKEEVFKTPKNATLTVNKTSQNSSTGAIPKRKEISPLIGAVTDDLTNDLRTQVQKLRDEDRNKKQKQQKISSLFQNKGRRIY